MSRDMSKGSQNVLYIYIYIYMAVSILFHNGGFFHNGPWCPPALVMFRNQDFPEFRTIRKFGFSGIPGNSKIRISKISRKKHNIVFLEFREMRKSGFSRIPDNSTDNSGNLECHDFREMRLDISKQSENPEFRNIPISRFG